MKNTYLVVDTETNRKGIPFDLSYTICNKNEILDTKGFLVEEIFNDARNTRDSFYGFKWFKRYPYLLAKNKISPAPIHYCWNQLNKDMKKFNVTHIVAYNLRYDINSTNKLFNLLNLTNPLCLTSYNFIDLWAMSCEILGRTKKYKEFCIENFLLTDKFNFKTNSSSMLSFIEGKVTETYHTGYEDSIHEAILLQKLLKKNKPYTQGDFVKQPWKILYELSGAE